MRLQKDYRRFVDLVEVLIIFVTLHGVRNIFYIQLMQDFVVDWFADIYDVDYFVVSTQKLCNSFECYSQRCIFALN